MSPAHFYIGKVGHQRFGETRHSLNYRIAYLLLDLDRLDEANKISRWLGIDSGGLLSFQTRDHGDGAATDLAAWVRAHLAEQGSTLEATRIELLTLPRMFGHVFNPISVYFIYGPDEQLHHVMYEVANTHHERHFYLCRAGDTGGPISHVCDKAFYVSPFFDISGTYAFKVIPPKESMSVHIRYDNDDGEKVLTATLSGKQRAVTSAACLKLIAGFPFMTLGVVAGIHWEAVKLWVKGVKFRRHTDKSKLVRTTQSLEPPVRLQTDA